MNVFKSDLETHLDSSGSFLGVPLQQVPHQGDSLVAGIWNKCLQVGGHTLGKAKVHRCGQMMALWPIRLRIETNDGRYSGEYSSYCMFIHD